MPDHPNATKPRQFRFTEDDLDLMDRIIAEKFPRFSRAELIRIAVTQLAEGFGIPIRIPKKHRKPT